MRVGMRVANDVVAEQVQPVYNALFGRLSWGLLIHSGSDVLCLDDFCMVLVGGCCYPLFALVNVWVTRVWGMFLFVCVCVCDMLKLLCPRMRATVQAYLRMCGRMEWLDVCLLRNAVLILYRLRKLGLLTCTGSTSLHYCQEHGCFCVFVLYVL